MMDTELDDIKVGDARRFINEAGSEHTVVNVADSAVEIKNEHGEQRLVRRPWYDRMTEPFPPEPPTFERGDVVRNASGIALVVEGLGADSDGALVQCRRPSGTTSLCQPKHLTPTGLKVPEIDEDQWWVMRDDGMLLRKRSRDVAELIVRRMKSATHIVTVRNGQLVTPVERDGVEHLVPLLSKPKGES